MKCNHTMELPEPIQENCDITVTDKNFRLQMRAQVRQQLNRAKTTTRAKNCIDIAALKKIHQISGATLSVTGKITFGLEQIHAQLDLEPFRTNGRDP